MDFSLVFFILKKIAGGMLMPLPLILMGSGLSVILLFTKRGFSWGRRLALATFIFAAIVCNSIISKRLLRPFEAVYDPLPD